MSFLACTQGVGRPTLSSYRRYRYRSNSNLRLVIPTIVYDTLFHPLVERVKSRMVVLADQGFHAAEGDLPNPKLCPRRSWNDRMLVETVLAMMTLVSGLKHVQYRYEERKPSK